MVLPTFEFQTDGFILFMLLSLTFWIWNRETIVTRAGIFLWIFGVLVISLTFLNRILVFLLFIIIFVMGFWRVCRSSKKRDVLLVSKIPSPIQQKPVMVSPDQQKPVMVCPDQQKPVMEIVRSIYGATIQPNGGGVFFRVWTPNIEHLYICGDFTEWKSPIELFRTTDDYFEGLVPSAKEGEQYKFLLNLKSDINVWRNDPRSPILQTNNGSINSVIYNTNTFQWSDQIFIPPPFQNMVIYEMHIASFGARNNSLDGTFLSCISHLDHLVNLGVNVIEVMPLNQDEHPCCWGYDPISMFAIHSQFGSPDHLKEFVNEAHRRGLAVILDWIPNHMSSTSVLTNFNTDDSHQLTDSTENNTFLGDYFYPDHRNKTEFGPRLDFSKPEVRKMIKDSILMWITDFHFDGLRVDSTITMRLVNEETLVEAWTLMQECNELVRRIDPRKIVIAEDLQSHPHINYVAGFDSQWDPEYFDIIYQIVKNPEDEARDMNRLKYTIEKQFTPTLQSRVIYTENHDSVPGDRHCRIPVAITPDPENNFFALKRSILAAAIMLTTPGIPMLLQGQEIFELECPLWNNPPSINWNRLNHRHSVLTMYKTLIQLRTNHGGLTKGLTGAGVNVFHNNQVNKVIGYHRYDKGGPQDDVIVLANFSNQNFNSYWFGLPRPGKWWLRFNSDSINHHNTFSGVGDVAYIESCQGIHDNYLFNGTVGLGRYSVIILSQ